jgi:hypothetical protein
MSDMRVSQLSTVLLLSALSLASAASAQSAGTEGPDDAVIGVRRTEDGRSILSIPISIPRGTDVDTLQATFDFGQTKGLGRDDVPVVNQDKSLIAVTNYPATKTSYVHLFMRHSNGDLTAINSFNLRVAKLLEGRWAKAAEYRLEATSISGRIVQLSVFDFIRGNESEEHRLEVSVGMDGTLALAR